MGKPVHMQGAVEWFPVQVESPAALLCRPSHNFASWGVLTSWTKKLKLSLSK